MKTSLKKTVIIVIISLFLLFFLYNHYNSIHETKNSEKYKVLLLGEPTKLITYKDKILDEKNYYFTSTSRQYYSAVKALKQGKKDSWIIMSEGPDLETLKILKLTLNNNDKIELNTFCSLKNSDHRFVERFISCDHKDLINGYGTKYRIFEIASNKYISLDNDFNKELSAKEAELIQIVSPGEIYVRKHIEGCVNISKKRAIYQVPEISDEFSDYYPSGLSKNYIFLVDQEKGGIVKELKTGFIPKYQGCSADEFNTPLPICISPDGKKAALLIRYETPDYKWFDADPAPVWLCTIDLKSLNVSKITTLNTNVKFGFSNYLPLIWHSYKDTDYVCLSIPAYSYNIDDLTPKHVSLLVDIKNKKIIKRWPWLSKSMRWSPDGKLLGMLSQEYIDKQEVQKLYIYNPETDNLAKIIQNNDWFDFFWIKAEYSPGDETLKSLE